MNEMTDKTMTLEPCPFCGSDSFVLMIDHHEGNRVTEENLQRWLADMLAASRHAPTKD